MGKKDYSLTSGNIYKALISFMVPIIISTLLQQFYNAVDSYVIGNYGGVGELAATGSTSSIIHALNALFAGISLGTTVVVARYRGSGDYENINRSNSTAIFFGFGLGAVVVSFGLIFARPLASWLDVPLEIMDMSLDYYRIYLIGFVFNAVYNITSGSIRALGNSKATMYYIVVSSIVNITLDYLFVAVFHWSVKGAAWATAIAMIVSAVLSIRKLCIYDEKINLNRNNLCFDKEIALNITKLGLPNGLQVMGSSISAVLSQKYINLFGTYAIAGVVVSNKVNSLINAPTHAFSPSATTFTSQNLGAGNYDRVKQGIRIQLIMSLIVSLSIALPIFIFSKEIAALFNENTYVIKEASFYIKVLVISEPLQCFSHIYNGTLRGGGNTIMPMFMTAFSQCVVKILFITIGLSFCYDIKVIYFSAVAVNLSMALLPYSYYRFSNWAKNNNLA